MSKHNKVNRDHYTQGGRLTPDEMAREQAKQREAATPKGQDGKPEGFQPRQPRVTPEDKESDAEE